MTMSFPTLCKFCELHKNVIAKQCNGGAAEIVTSHAMEIWDPFFSGILDKVLATFPCDLEDHSGVFDMN